ncbi:MAG: STAS domain-containing protein [Ignavibacteria bacterium]|nr:STAS domain-containing protein [Ignavibacteria bacterium]
MIIEGKEFKAVQISDNDLGLSNIGEMKKKIEDELELGNINIALDLKDLNSINSSGLGVLIGILNRVKTKNGSLKMLNADERIMHIFKITKLDLIFDFKV